MTLSAIQFRLHRLFGQIWLRLSVYSAAAILTALAAVLLRPMLPAELEYTLGAGAIEPVLTILASSMLAVSTFSLGVMTSAIAGAAGSATPRATALLLEDSTSQKVLSTFLGAFIFALVGLIGIKIGLYQNGGRIVLMAVTLVVIVLIFVSFVRWISQLRTFGRISDTLERVEQAARKSLAYRVEHPYLGCHRLVEGGSDGKAIPLVSSAIGYVRHIDLGALQRLAETHDARVFIHRPPGAFTTAARPLASIRSTAVLPDEARRSMADCFDVGVARTFEQDPRFAMLVLAETASRALSPAINDPGTAIDVLRRSVRILSAWRERATPQVLHDRLHIEPITAQSIMRDLFRPIARDSAGLVEVQHVIQTSLLELAELAPGMFSRAALEMSREALARAEASLPLDVEREEVRELARKVEAACAPDGEPLTSAARMI